jgi:hypothetical protein
MMIFEGLVSLQDAVALLSYDVVVVVSVAKGRLLGKGVVAPRF